MFGRLILERFLPLSRPTSILGRTESRCSVDAKDPILLDVNRFSSREDWLNFAQGDLPKAYTNLASARFAIGAPKSSAHILYQSFVSKGRGLHEGSYREIVANNPHGVFPLNRAFLELVSLLLYSIRNPYYIDVLTGAGPNRSRAKKKFQAIFDAIKDEAPGMKDAYKELSDYSHFGALAVYNVHVPEGEEILRRTSWTDAPRWSSEDDFRIACSQLSELHVELIAGLGTFSEKYLNGYPGVTIIGEFT